MTAFPPLVIRGRLFAPWYSWPPCDLRSRPAFLSIARPSWRDFLLSALCGGYSGVLSGLFFCGIIFHLPILSACVGFLVPSRNRRRIIPLLQGLYRDCTGRFPGVASCTTSGAFAHPAPSGQLPGGQGSTVAVIPSQKPRRFFAGNLKDSVREFFSDFSPAIVDSR